MKVAEVRCVSVLSLHGGPERPLSEAVKPGCVGNPKVVEMPGLWDTCQGELHTNSMTFSQGRTELASVGSHSSLLMAFIY